MRNGSGLLILLIGDREEEAMVAPVMRHKGFDVLAEMEGGLSFVARRHPEALHQVAIDLSPDGFIVPLLPIKVRSRYRF